jgi:hypothetical protein
MDASNRQLRWKFKVPPPFVLSLVACLILFVPSALLAAGSADAQWSPAVWIKKTKLSFAGIGVIKIHGKFDPLVQWLQRRGSQMSVQSQPHTSIDDVATMFCADVTFFVGFANLGAQFRNGRIERVDVLDSAIQTAAGIHIGSTEQQVRDAYSGRLLEFEGDIDHSANVSDSSQTQGEHAFIVKSPDYDRDQLALLIETNGTEVVGLHTGTKWAFGRYNDSVEAKSCLDFGEEDTPNSFD